MPHGATGWVGLATLLAFVAAALFPAHRLLVRLPDRLRPGFRASAWLRAHRAIGGLALVLACIHVGARWPRGSTGLVLLSLLVLSLASAALIELLVKQIPRLLTERLRVSEPAALVPARVAQLAEEARTLAAGFPPAARQAFDTGVAPQLAALRVRLRPPAPAEVAAPVAAIEAAWPAVTDLERETLDDLRTLLREKLELDTQHGLEGALGLARLAHALVSGALIGLAAVHGSSFWIY
ncbi:MAG: hypothetical protein NDJ94_04425 [Vicinamibacteria bacterium]|jgi:hypothetical protein|nr:hypothetical protein [Vicinamibacteria bacterium]